jgi:CobQ-like glutamine amidotransferase family enzyme
LSLNSSLGRLAIVHVYPTLLGLYGDRGNVLVLAHRARNRHIEVDVINVGPGEAVPRQADIYVIGGGEDMAQVVAADLLRSDGGLVEAIGRNAAVLAVCAGYQILGSTFEASGAVTRGLEVLDVTTVVGHQRAVGEAIVVPTPELGLPGLTGFENHSGRTTRGSGLCCLGRVVRGIGNGDGTEGLISGRVIGTYLHGPVLARNPAVADLLLSWAVGSELITPLSDPTSEALRATYLDRPRSPLAAAAALRRRQV